MSFSSIVRDFFSNAKISKKNEKRGQFGGSSEGTNGQPLGTVALRGSKGEY